jgi:hypothetical protein
MAEIRKGKGWYNCKVDGKVNFEIEIMINGNVFTGRVFNEESKFPEARIENGKITDDAMTFTKKYPKEVDSSIYYTLKKSGQNNFIGGWRKVVIDFIDNDVFSAENAAGIIFG